MELTIRDATRVMKGQLILGDPKSQVLRSTIDSRLTQKGDLFFALKGQQVDGHDYAAVAAQEGAQGVVVSNLNWMKEIKNFSSAVIRVLDPEKSLKTLGQHVRNGFRGPVVGVTGSNGKTTTKQMLKQILSELGPGLATQGNYNSQLGLPLILSRLTNKHQWMVLEMGATEPGNIMGLAEMARPKVGIITSLGPAHLATFGSMERVAESKWELMDSLPHDGTAVLPWGVSLLEKHIRSFNKKIIYFGDDSSCSVRASALEVGEKIRFRLHIGSDSAFVTLPMAGRFNVSNALASAAASWSLGATIEQIVKGLEGFEPPQMRMETKVHKSGAILMNDAYNANPTSMMESVRSVVETYPQRRKVLVLGSMLELGQESDRWHFHVGTELGRFKLERVFLVGKEMEQVQNGAVSVGAKKELFSVMEEPDQVQDGLAPYLQSDAVLLFKGSRGVQLEKILKGLNS